MKQCIGAISILVRDYDEAIAYYTTKLGFRLLEDTPRSATKRWVIVAPPGSDECRLLLAQAVKPEEVTAIGNQSGGRVFLFLHTDDFWRDYRAFTARGVHFAETPREEPYGTVAVFTDLYGNRWDLLQLNPPPPPPWREPASPPQFSTPSVHVAQKPLDPVCHPIDDKNRVPDSSGFNCERLCRKTVSRRSHTLGNSPPSRQMCPGLFLHTTCLRPGRNVGHDWDRRGKRPVPWRERRRLRGHIS